MCGHVVHTGIDMCVYWDRCHAHRRVHVCLSPSVQLNIYVHGHPSIFRYMYFGAASRRACGRAVAAGARAGALARAASASGYNRRSECVGVPITRMRVCVRAMRGDFPVASARSAPRLPIVARRARPHARAVRGRSISSTKVKALPEWLGQCKLLEQLCVPRPPPRRRARLRRCGRCAAARGATAPGRWGRAARRWMRRRRRCRSSAVGRAPRAHGWRARPTGWAFAVGRSRPARPHGRRAGGRTTPSSRRCRR